MPESAKAEMPEHVANFAWATGKNVEHVFANDYYVLRGDYVDYKVPDLETPEWRCAVMDGLIARFGYGISIEHSGEPMTPIVARETSKLPIVWEVELLGKEIDDPESPYRELLGYGESASLNAALNAACTQAREHGSH